TVAGDAREGTRQERLRIGNRPVKYTPGSERAASGTGWGDDGSHLTCGGSRERRGVLRVDVGARGLPVPREQLRASTIGMGGDAFQHVLQVSPHIDRVRLARRDDAVQDGR